MHARSDPGAELLVVEPEQVLQRRQDDDRERAAERDERDREGDLVLVCLDHPVCRGDRRDAADREPGRDEQREVVGDAESPTRPACGEERDRDDRDDDEQRLQPEREDVGEDEVEPEQDDAEPAAPARRRRGGRARPQRERETTFATTIPSPTQSTSGGSA